MDAAEVPVATCEFDFDEQTFRDCYELRFVPHDRSAGLAIALVGFVLVSILVGTALYMVAQPAFREDVLALAAGAEGSGSWAAAVAALLLLAMPCAAVALWGVRLRVGRRRPRWGAPRWEARTDLAFRALSEGATSFPVPRGCWLSLPSRGSGWAHGLWLYDWVPGLLPRLPRVPAPAPARSIPFSVTFYGDRLVKGRPGGGMEVPYRDVYDVVECKRFPDLALIRLVDAKGEVLVKKSALEGATWDEVRGCMEAANGWLSLRR